jgi:hypothetical protein
MTARSMEQSSGWHLWFASNCSVEQSLPDSCRRHMYSGWPEVRGDNLSTQSITAFFNQLATTWDYPKIILSKNGTQFTSVQRAISRDFCQRRDIRHERASVYNPPPQMAKSSLSTKFCKAGLQKCSMTTLGSQQPSMQCLELTVQRHIRQQAVHRLS